MRFLRTSVTNALMIAIMSVFYAAVFIVTSNHLEFNRLLDHGITLQSDVWNAWSVFLKQGYLKYIGYLYILIAMTIVIFSITRKRDYDEYQSDILEKGLVISGFLMFLLFPIALLLILSDPNYSVECLLFLVVVHWFIVLFADFVYVIKWGRD